MRSARRGRRHGQHPEPQNMDIPWERTSLARSMPSMSLADPAMDEGRGLSLAVDRQPGPRRQAVRRLGPYVPARSSTPPTPASRCPISPSRRRIKATVAVKRAEVTSQNVVAVLPGSDPKLKDEYVVFSAHLDHLGIGKPINGDSIYNGAMDNASGVAGLLDVAAIFKETGARPKRSVLFVAVTGEEKGLLGSRYFAKRPDGRRQVDRRRHQHRHVPAALPAQAADRLRARRVGPGRRRDGRGQARRRCRPPRPRAEAEHLHPQRPVQLHPARHPVADADGRLREGIARRKPR